MPRLLFQLGKNCGRKKSLKAAAVQRQNLESVPWTMRGSIKFGGLDCHHLPPFTRKNTVSLVAFPVNTGRDPAEFRPNGDKGERM